MHTLRSRDNLVGQEHYVNLLAVYTKVSKQIYLF